MKKIILSSFFTTSLLFANSVVPHDQDYFTKDVRNTQLIYTEKNSKDAAHVANIEELLQPQYEKSFGYVMDEILYVGLVSDYNQIANGFSTPLPVNRQINYIGGTQSIDYFSSTSWIDTLIYHESAHNYQVNAKDNIISSSIHTIFKNGAFFVGYFNLPNAVTSSFLLEGNAVLNESWHGNGGRLYSGRFATIMLHQAKAGNITPAKQYTETNDFLYREKNYIMGSFYQYYLARKYGLDAVNSYWKNQSQDWFWPFFVNNSSIKSVGISFEKSIEEWNNSLRTATQKMKDAPGKHLARSQFFTSLNSDEDEIFFLTNESGRRVPEVVTFNKETQEVSKERESFPSGRLIKYKEKLYAQSSRKDNPWRIYQGLLDNNAHFLESSKGKMVQGYLNNAKAVYFDVSSSYDQAQLYVGEDYYATVHSSVIIDKEDNLYYFKQKDKIRTLYKNQTALYSFESFYGLVSDVDSIGNVYFIANSKYGSSLYKFDGEKASRVSSADNVIEARLINDSEVLIAAVNDSEYYYVKNDLETLTDTPYVVHLFMEDEPYYKQALDQEKEVTSLDLNDDYYSLLDMHYSGTDLSLAKDVNVGYMYNFSINFGDPLEQNSFSIFSQRDVNAITIAGAGYSNSQYFINYTVQAYAVVDKDEYVEARDYGIVASANLPFYQRGYTKASLQASYYQDYLSDSRVPLSSALEVYRAEQFGASLRPNSLYYAKVYGAMERDDIIAGGYIKYAHDLPWEIYVSLDAQYSLTNAEKFGAFEDRGVQLRRSKSSYDPSAIAMPSLNYTSYLKEAAVAHTKIEKVFNASFYYFTFPLSLQRESIFVGYNHYDLKTLNQVYHDKVNEVTMGMMFQFVVMNKLVLPITLEYIQNDTPEIAQKEYLNIQFGVSF